MLPFAGADLVSAVHRLCLGLPPAVSFSIPYVQNVPSKSISHEKSWRQVG